MVLDKSKCIKLFANCVIVDGPKRATISDLQRGGVEFIPLGMFEVLKNYPQKSIFEIIEDVGLQNEDAILEYVEFILDKDYGHLCSKSEWDKFPEIEIKHYSYSDIENAIIDIDGTLEFPFKSIFSQLEELGCRTIEVRIFYDISKNYLESVLGLLDQSTIENVNLVCPFSEYFMDEKQVKGLLLRFPRVISIVFHSASITQIDAFEFDELLLQKIVLTSQSITSSDHCGQVSPSYFRSTLNFYVESRSANNCLNKKISIDVKGNIKNCPSMIEAFGNIKETKLKDSLRMKDFKTMWSVSKDQIETCKVCEFRYLCSDCRAFTDLENSKFGKPSKCTYDPYNITW